MPSEALLLLWLARADAERSPLDATQAGIAMALGVSRSQASRLAGLLLRRGLVEAGSQRLAGFPRRVRSYALTAAGTAEAASVRSALERRPVRVGQGEPVSVLPLAEALRAAGSPLTLWDALHRLDGDGHLDVGGDRPVTEEGRGGYRRELAEAPPERAFSGRRAHLDEVHDWLRSPSAALVVEAPAGQGKSALAAHAARTLAGPRHVLWVRVGAALTPEAFLARLGRFLAVLGRPGPLDAGDSAGLQSALRARLGRIPALVVLDDVHKASADLQPVLWAVVRAAVGGTPKIWLLGRDVAVPHDALPDVRHLALGPLPDDEAGDLLATLGVDAGERPRLVGLCGGDPLFLALAARGSPATGRTDVARYILGEVAPELLPAALAVLHCLSALRTPAAPALLARLGLDDEGTLLRLEQRNLAFRDARGALDMHDLVRATLYGSLGAAARHGLHARLAEAYRPDGDWSGAVEFLHHLGRAERREEAVRWLLRNKTRFLAATQDLIAR
ncbi:MAG: hypothetical protein QOI63_1224 [Thermoplasmata archaeon]|nr:hypothetical protein [Thermoplasmata archaeon]